MAAAVVLGLPQSVGGTVCRSCAKEPDLVVSDAKYSGDPWAFQGDEVTFSFKDTTENLGKGAAGPSRTGMLLRPLNTPNGPLPPLRLGSRAVPALSSLSQPGSSSSGGASDTVDTTILPLGAYRILVCADLNNRIKNEKREQNNCAVVGRFYVIQKQWRGSVMGIAGGLSASKLERWHTLGAHLDFHEPGGYLGNGRFRYDFSGTVVFTDHGLGFACTYDGHGVKAFNQVSGVVLDYLRGSYGGEVPIDDSFYKITVSGGEPGIPCSGTIPGPISTDILRTRTTQNLNVLPYNLNELKGSFGSAVAENTLWTWDFQ